MEDIRQIKSYVWHGDKCFFVSTIERDSSASDGPRRFFETYVYNFDWKTNVRGEMIGGDGGGPAFEQHYRIAKHLFDNGVFPD